MPSPPHLRSLTGMPFFAALLVVAYHAGVQSDPTHTQSIPLLGFGYLGVTFFFVLSGFVLVWSFRPGSVKDFYRRRFARVWPMHALTLAVVLALVLAGVLESSSPRWSVLANGALLQSWWVRPDVAFSFNGVSWSLSNEAFFYAVLPALMAPVAVAGGGRTIGMGVTWLVGGGVIGELFGFADALGAFPLYRVGEFVVGMGVARLVIEGTQPSIRLGRAGAFALGTYLALIALNAFGTVALGAHQWVVSAAMVPATCALLLAGSLSDLSGTGTWLSSPVVVRLGQWSFALYLVHEIVLRAARPFMLDHAWSVWPVVVMTVAVAGVCYEWFEKPVERRIRGRRILAPVA